MLAMEAIKDKRGGAEVVTVGFRKQSATGFYRSKYWCFTRVFYRLDSGPNLQAWHFLLVKYDSLIRSMFWFLEFFNHWYEIKLFVQHEYFWFVLHFNYVFLPFSDWLGFFFCGFCWGFLYFTQIWSESCFQGMEFQYKHVEVALYEVLESFIRFHVDFYKNGSFFIIVFCVLLVLRTQNWQYAPTHDGWIASVRWWKALLLSEQEPLSFSPRYVHL